MALTEGLGIGVGVGVGEGVCIGKGVVVGGVVGVKASVGVGAGIGVRIGVGVVVGTGLTNRPQPIRRNPTRRRETAILRFRPIAKHPCKTRFKLQKLSTKLRDHDACHRHFQTDTLQSEMYNP